jgi:hypothetical protein
MNAKPIIITTVLSAALLAGCDQGADKSGAAPITPPPPTVTQNGEQPQATPPTAAERKDGGAPVQGQVDTKEPAQRDTFQPPKG